MGSPRFRMFAIAIGVVCLCSQASYAELFVGTATVDITPELPVALDGQFHLRIAKTIETPLEADVIVLQSRRDGRPQDSAVMVSCDLVYITKEVLGLVRGKVRQRIGDLDTSRIVLSGTHTHTAPVTVRDKYPIPKKGVTQVEEYCDFLADRVAEGIVEAWKRLAPGSVSWGLGHAVVGYNRRAAYADGHAQMYGRTNVAEFRNLEGYEDHDVDQLFFWDSKGRLTGLAVSIACPTQEVESRSAVNADFWHPTREALRKRFGPDLCVVSWVGAAGDQSPHLMYRRAADDRMRELRGLTRVEEIARRIVRAVEETYEVVQKDRHLDVPLIHKVETLRLPMRLVTEAEYAETKAICDRLKAQIADDPKARDRLLRRLRWYEETVERFKRQESDPHLSYEMELHVLRLGDVAICTNPFELFTDYGIRIKARSPAVQTFVVQLVGPGTYLPTEKAVRGGGYSAVVHSSLVGPEGGQVLVDRTVELIKELWQPLDHAPKVQGKK
ncbi:MAG TPA: hypothetical protein EYP56_16400 [Planctomycetaceae bacterium]|nr:hypothetical protein [Planctomycetaceae bacterium]